MDFINLNSDEILEMVKNHPLNIFIKLHAENKENKVYKNCLENEINNAIKCLSKEADDETIIFLKNMYDCCALNEQEISLFCKEASYEELNVKLYAMKKIIDNVYSKRIKK